MGAVDFDYDGWRGTLCRYGAFWSLCRLNLAWFIIVLPCLLLNYAGQGALLLRDTNALENPFYLLIPEWALFPMIGLATAAAGLSPHRRLLRCILDG